MDEHDPFLRARFASRPVPRRKAEEGEATDLVAAIFDWADTTDHDRDDLDRWLRRLLTGRDPEPAGTCHRALGSAGRGTLDVNLVVDQVDPGEYSAAHDEAG